jgi:hypothetical protein
MTPEEAPRWFKKLFHVHAGVELRAVLKQHEKAKQKFLKRQKLKQQK